MKNLFTCFCLVLLFEACSENSSNNSFVGEYSFEEDRASMLKVTEENDTLYLYVAEYVVDESKTENDDDSNLNMTAHLGKLTWTDKTALRKVPQDEFKVYFGENWKDKVYNGINAGDFWLFKVKKGAEYQGEKFKSEFFMKFVDIGNIYKKD